MADVRGDVGARHLIGEHEDRVCEVEMDDDGVLLDVDSPAALASLLGTFNLLAFLFHTVLDLMDARYRRLRQFLPRKRFFNDLRALTCYLCFDSWDALMAFMINGLELEAPDTS